MFSSCISSVLSYCIGVWGGVFHCTSCCDDISRIHRKIVKYLFSNFFINSCCFLRETGILKNEDIYKLTEALYMYNIFKYNKYPCLRFSLYMSYPSHDYHTRNNNDMLLPSPRVEAIRMNFFYQFVKVWLGIPEYIKCQRTCAKFNNALTDYYLSRY